MPISPRLSYAIAGFEKICKDVLLINLMDIKFTGPKEVLTEVSRDAVGARCVQVLDEMRMPKERFNLFHFACQGAYGLAITDIDPDGDYSDNELFEAGAKVIRVKDERGGIRSSTVFRLEPMHHFITEAASEPDPSAGARPATLFSPCFTTRSVTPWTTSLAYARRTSLSMAQT